MKEETNNETTNQPIDWKAECERLQKRVDGYEAADIVVEEFISKAREELNDSPNEYRRGYFEGLAMANAFLAWGQFPEIPENAEKIKEVMLASLKAGSAELATLEGKP